MRGPEESSRGLAGSLTCSRGAWLAVAFGVGTIGVYLLRELPWSLAGLVGLAFAVLLGAGFRTFDQLRGSWRTESNRRELLRRESNTNPPKRNP